MREVIRRNWRFWVTLAEVLLLTTFFAHYIGHRQTLADQRTERQRRAICAILANIPGQIPPEIMRARQVFARPGHPHDCQVVTRPAVKRTPIPTPRPAPTPTATVVINRSLPRPAATVTAKPPATRSPRPSPSPTPSPSQTCVPLTRICT